jgi:hypothetical protein
MRLKLKLNEVIFLLVVAVGLWLLLTPTYDPMADWQWVAARIC